MAGEVKTFSGQTNEAYPELFTTVPPQGPVNKPGQLTEKQLHEFFQEGFVIVNDVFKPEELEPCKEAINKLVEELAQKLYNAGKVTSLYSEYGFYQRLSMLEKEFPGANIILHKLGHLPQAFRDVWSNERLLNVAEQILGTADILGHPVWNLRTKTPKSEAVTVPWHQDSGYLSNDSYNVMQLTGWIPLLDSNEANGCMQMMRRGHRTGHVATHTCCFGDTHYIMLEPDEMRKTLDIDPEKDVATCPVPYGGVIFFSNMIPHHSLNNHSDQIRWSLDLRWQRADKPVGFYGLKEGLRMRSSTDPSFKVDWETFDQLDRQKEQYKAVGVKVTDEFSTTVGGPWMKKWEMVHTNRHTDSVAGDQLSWHVTAGLTG